MPRTSTVDIRLSESPVKRDARLTTEGHARRQGLVNPWRNVPGGAGAARPLRARRYACPPRTTLTASVLWAIRD